MFPSPCPLPDSPEAARREAIDYLAHKMDFVMFRVNIQHGKRLSDYKDTCLPLGCDPLNMAL